MTKISQLSSIGDSLAIDDQFIIRDVSDVSTPNKSITISGITRALDLGSAAAPAIAFASDKNSGLYSPGADQVAISTNGTSRIVVDASGNVNIDSGTFYVDAANNRVGIGTTGPGSTLSIGASATGGYNGGVYLNRGASTYNFYEASDGTNTVIFGLDNTISNVKIGTVNSYPLGFYTGNLERVRIDTSGRLLVGTSSARGLFFAGGASALTQIEGNSTGTASLSITRNDATADGNALILAKARSTAYAILQYVDGTTNDDRIGRISFQGADGTNMVPAASIEAWTDATPGANDMPGRLVFSTTADGAASPTERMRITSTGQVRLAGAGITFNGDTAAANELDDYEEGTWTPSDGSGAGRTFTNQSSTYVKIGRQVTVISFFVVDVSVSAAGFQVNGLPFSSLASTQTIGTFGSSGGNAGISALPASSSFVVIGTPATYNTVLTNAQVSNAGVAFTITYFV